MTPNFLVKYKNKILHTGKYLNVIRECGRDIKYSSDQAEDLPREDLKMEVHDQLEGPKYQFEVYEHIDKAYLWSSKKLLEVIFQEGKLLERLDSMKHYFFMDRGDFFAHLLDGSEDLFEKTSEAVTREKLDSYLELAIRSSSVKSDPYKDDVGCTLNKLGISEQLFVTKVTSGKTFQGQKFDANQLNLGQHSRNMKVYESFTLTLNVSWPLSLVISKKALNKY
mmetsp:Transcript_9370/g.14248  ORF Transcript_9370/g.14248 Transcript_9370/m.14248 type:complete len:223 (+) Transcript_9370:1375-2043(+)